MWEEYSHRDELSFYECGCDDRCEFQQRCDCYDYDECKCQHNAVNESE